MTESDTIKRDEVQWLNAQAMGLLSEQSGFRLLKEKGWRPTAIATGYIEGLESLGSLEIHATNGVLGVFVNAAGIWQQLHTQRFTGEIKPRYSTSDAKAKAKSVKPKKESKRALLERLFLEM